MLTAAVATLTYIAKATLEWCSGVLDRRRQRRAALMKLYALLRATAVTFLIQRKNVNRLCEDIRKRRKAKAPSLEQGYESFLSKAYPSMTGQERDLHGVIRAITEHMMRPLNQAVLFWINNDTYFKARTGKDDYGQLARHLASLELHLLMWNAKFEAWIPKQPNHALVYLDDESEHGIGFPHEVGGVLKKILAQDRDKEPA